MNIFHGLLMWLILPTSILALGLGCRRHKDQFVIGLGILGLSLSRRNGYGWS